jgi:SAM-dependent methyltransferase
MRQHINILNLLPVGPKPTEVRAQATNFDRRQHWKLSNLYFDGSREQGYGGYYKDQRWEPVANFLIEKYKLGPTSRILELGCAKGFLLSEIRKLIPKIELWGLDISRYALENVRPKDDIFLVQGNFESLPFRKKYFDLVICLNSMHNILTLNETIRALGEIDRISRNSIISVAAYTNLGEKMFLDEWAVVASTYLTENDWLKVFKLSNYQGDYDWFQPWKISD